LTDAPAAAAPLRARLAVEALVALGGMAALSWQVLWQLQASLALGVSSLGTAITLATTMAGMTLGSLAAGRWLRDRAPARPLRMYGALELAIGLAGLLMLAGFGVLEALDARAWRLAPSLAPALHAAGIALLLGPPTLAMGATVPVFAHVARHHGVPISILYGMNTLGAACGTLLVAFVMIRALGVAQTCLVVACVNLAVFAGCWLAAPGARAGAAEAEATPAPAAAPLPALYGLVVFGTGFVTFGLEVAWFRSLRAAFQSVTESFAIMLVAVLVPLGVAARLAAPVRRRGVSPGLLLTLAGVAVLCATPVVERIDLIVPLAGDYGAMLFQWAGLCLAVLGPPMLLLGLVLPWVLDALRDPARCAAAYALNTAGAVAGALLAAWVLLPAVGFARSAWLLGGILVALALPLLRAGGRPLALAAGAVALAVAVGSGESLGRERVQGPGFALLEEPRVLAHAEGPDATVSVVAGARGERFLLIDGFTASAEGSEGTEYMEWMGRLPMLAHPDPRNALVICFGTGRTANAVREERPQHLDVIELSPAVLAMASWFPSNRDVLADARVNAVVMDGRAWLRRSDRRYDVVTLEPMPPNFAGVNALYSREFYEIAAARLAPAGVVAQWLPLHLLPPFHAASVAATFQRVFPDAVLWVGPGSGTGILLGRLKSRATPLGRSWPGLGRTADGRPAAAEQVARFVALNSEKLLRYGDLGVPISDDNQQLAYGLVRRDVLAFGPRLAEINLRVVRDAARGGRVRLPAPPTAPVATAADG
jgi:spermidine synthase